jgi:phosphatidylglycerophosphatase C
VAHDPSAEPPVEDILPRCSAAEVIERLAAAREKVPAGAQALLAFDADNTIWKGDVSEDVFEALLTEEAVRPAAAEALARLAAEVGVGVGLPPAAMARALHDSWEKQLTPSCPEEAVMAMMVWIYAGFTLDELVAFSDRVLTRATIRDRIRPEVRQIVSWAHANGVEVLAVSASPRTVVEVGVRHLGIGPERVLAMTSKVEGGVIQPEIAGVFVYGEGKATAVEQARPGAVLLGGFGDSGYDAALMRMSAVPVAIAPGPSLLSAAKDVPGIIELDVGPSCRVNGPWPSNPS